MLTLTALLSLCFVLLEDELKSWDEATRAKVSGFLYLMIFCINLLYLLYWLLSVFRYTLKLLRITPRYAHIYKCLTCGQGEEVEEKDAKAKLEEAADQDDAEGDEDLEKIDMLIQHLADVQ